MSIFIEWCDFLSYGRNVNCASNHWVLGFKKISFKSVFCVSKAISLDASFPDFFWLFIEYIYFKNIFIFMFIQYISYGGQFN